MACYGGLYGILAGLTKSADHPSTVDPDPHILIIHHIQNGGPFQLKPHPSRVGILDSRVILRVDVEFYTCNYQHHHFSRCQIDSIQDLILATYKKSWFLVVHDKNWTS